MRPGSELRPRRRRSVRLTLTVVAAVSALSSAPTAAADVAPDQVALATLDEIVRGDFPAAAAEFNPTMKMFLSPAALQQSWDVYQQMFGRYLSHGTPENVARGDTTVVNVPLQMDRRPGQFRLTVQPDGTVAALTFLREGVPVP
ncbi:hypothetical protein [Mycobacterium sp. C31M]